MIKCRIAVWLIMPVIGFSFHLGLIANVSADDYVGGDQDEAIHYYNQAEEKLESGALRQALRLYNAAKATYDYDGFIEQLTGENKNLIPKGRSFVIETRKNYRRVSYFPNKKIAQVRRMIKRRMPPVLTLALRLRDSSGDATLEANETATLEITLVNEGDSDAENVIVRISSNQPGSVRFQERLQFGTVKHGDFQTRKVEVVALKKLLKGSLKLKVKATEIDHFDSQPKVVAIDTRGFLPPNLVVTELSVSDQNGNATIEQVEFVKVSYTIKNIGLGVARDVVSRLSYSKNVRLADDEDRLRRLNDINVGQSKTVSFQFYTNKKIKAGEPIPLALNVTESEGEFGVYQNLGLKMSDSTSTHVHFAMKKPAAFPVALVSDVDVNIPTTGLVNNDAIAVIIGNADYQTQGVPRVKFALNDARVMKKYLISVLGYREGNIIYVENASSGKFMEIFGKDKNNHRGKLFSWVKPGKSDVFVYYTGHGAPDLNDNGSAYFVPVDADPNYIGNTGYALDTLYHNLAKINARSVTVVLDSCFSGNSNDGFLLQNISPALVKVNVPVATDESTTVISSSAKDEVSSWYPDQNHGLFTYFFLKALRGDADLDKDKTITMSEMKQYLGENVTYMARRLNNKNQHPLINGDESRVLVAY